MKIFTTDVFKVWKSTAWPRVCALMQGTTWAQGKDQLKKIKHETEIWCTWLVFRILQVTEKNRKIAVTLLSKRKVVVLSLRTCKGVTNHCWCLCKALLINREKQQMVCAATSFPPYYHWQKASLKIESQRNIPPHLSRSYSALWFYALIPYSETLQTRKINKSLTLCNSHCGKTGSLYRQTLGLYVFGTKWITYLGVMNKWS